MNLEGVEGEYTKNMLRKIQYYKSLQVTRPFYLRTSPVNTHSQTNPLQAIVWKKSSCSFDSITRNVYI